MLHHVKRIAKKKSVIAACMLAIVPATVLIQRNASSEPVRYVASAVTRGALVTSISGTGQVSGQSQVDLKPNVSGAVTKILVKAGATVKKDDPLFVIDDKEAAKTVRDAMVSVNDARLSVESALLSLQKLKEPPDAVSLLQSQHSVAEAKRALEELQKGTDPADIRQAERELDAQKEEIQITSDGKTPQVVRDAYDQTIPVLKSVAQTLQQALVDGDTIIGVDNTSQNDSYERLLSALDATRLIRAKASYAVAKPIVQKAVTSASLLALMDVSIDTITEVSDQLYDALDAITPFLQDTQDALSNTITSSSFTQSSLDSLRNTIQSARTNVSSKLTSLTTQLQSIDKAKSSYTSLVIAVEKSERALEKLKAGAEPKDIESATERLSEAEASLARLQKGATQSDLKASENSVSQRRSSLTQAYHRLTDAQEVLKTYTIRAPFDGVVVKIPVQVSDQASPSVVLATLSTEAKMITMSVNEVDVAKIKTQQKATVTFDALTDLSIAGVVSEVDSVGTATQGVVNYTVKIALITQDERIKTGMSASAAIVTDSVTDALLVSNAAVTTLGANTTVRLLTGVDATEAQSSQGVVPQNAPIVQVVQTGLSNDQMTVITEGLQEGDLVVIRTIDPKAAAAASARTPQGGAQSGARIPGNTTFGGGATFTTGAVRINR